MMQRSNKYNHCCTIEYNEHKQRCSHISLYYLVPIYRKLYNEDYNQTIKTQDY